eukprot:scaffold1672_cov366-Prasinococcus_capsulatus_cf.AAC.13
MGGIYPQLVETFHRMKGQLPPRTRGWWRLAWLVVGGPSRPSAERRPPVREWRLHLLRLGTAAHPATADAWRARGSLPSLGADPDGCG